MEKVEVHFEIIRKVPTYSATVAKAKKIETLLAERFRARWKAVEADFATGVDVAGSRAHCFLASDSRARLRTARRYYTPARASKFATLPDSEILQLCWAWFNPHFSHYVSCTGKNRGGGQVHQSFVFCEKYSMRFADSAEACGVFRLPIWRFWGSTGTPIPARPSRGAI
jgi:hypothetical protein